MDRRLVISDIHGCCRTFKTLIENIALTRTDTLYLLGDYIDRGTDSSGVIDYILNLQSQHYKIIPLRGNHEENLLSANEEYDRNTFKFFVAHNKSTDLLTSDGNIKEQYISFFNQLPCYVELTDFILVHAGINFTITEPLTDKNSLLELRLTHYDKVKANNRRIVFGHQPYYIEDIMQAINTRAFLIPLDNGCFYTKPHKIYDYKRLGSLICFDLDSFYYTMQKNVDF